MKLSGPSEGFGTAVGVRGTGEDGGKSYGQRRNMGERIQVGGTSPITHPETFLSGGLKAGIVTLTLGAQGVGAFETQTFPVNGKSVIIGNSLVFGAAPVFLAIIPVFVVTRTTPALGVPERAAEFLSGTPIVPGFAVLVHSEPGLADQISGRQLFYVFCVAFVERNYRLTLINIFHQMVNATHIVGLVRKKSTLSDRQDAVCGSKDFFGNAGIGTICNSGQFIERQARDAVNQHMTFVTPVEFIMPFVVLVGGRVNSQPTIRVAFGLVFLGELLFHKGFRVVLLGISGNGRRIQANEGSVHDAQLIEPAHLFRHDCLQFPVFHLPQKAVVGPIGGQRLHDVKSTVMGNEAVVF